MFHFMLQFNFALPDVLFWLD